jgi:hypothetical protein
MGQRRYETTDGRYKSIGEGTEEWWDTTGIELVSRAVVDEYIEKNPRVGIVVLEVAGEEATH